MPLATVTVSTWASARSQEYNVYELYQSAQGPFIRRTAPGVKLEQSRDWIPLGLELLDTPSEAQAAMLQLAALCCVPTLEIVTHSASGEIIDRHVPNQLHTVD